MDEQKLTNSLHNGVDQIGRMHTTPKAPEEPNYCLNEEMDVYVSHSLQPFERQEENYPGCDAHCEIDYIEWRGIDISKAITDDEILDMEAYFMEKAEMDHRDNLAYKADCKLDEMRGK